jgi:hypothetical protein
MFSMNEEDAGSMTVMSNSPRRVQRNAGEAGGEEWLIKLSVETLCVS